MRAKHPAKLALVSAVFFSVAPSCVVAQEQKRYSTCWSCELVIAMGLVYDAPGGNPIGVMKDDDTHRAVDHWQGNWALVTSETDPRVGWIMRESIKRHLHSMSCYTPSTP